MGRPLRAVYANSTYSTGVQEMSDSDITNLVAPIILNYVIANPNTSYGTRLRTTSATYDVSRGTAVDTRNSAVNVHPASNTTVSTYELFQSERAQTPVLTARPVQYTMVGSEAQIKPMLDQDLYDYLYPAVTNFMLTGGQGAYYLGLTSSGSPSGTWTSYGTLNDTYYVGSTLTTDQYTLWQRTDAATIGTIRPLKYTAYGTGVPNRLEEMTNADVEALAVYIGEYIRTTGIGQYAFQVSAPGTGTWVSRGSFVNKINNLVDTGYIGDVDHSFTGAFTGTYTGTFTGAYAGTYNNTFTGLYSGTYNQAFTGAYSSTYSKLFTSAYTGIYSRAFTGTFTGLYNNFFSRTFTSVYTGAYTGTYIGPYTRAFTSLIVNLTFSGTYVHASSQSGTVYYGQVGPEGGRLGYATTYYVSYFTGFYGVAPSFIGYYAGPGHTEYTPYGAVYYAAISYAGSYSPSYYQTRLQQFTGAYTSIFAGNYTSPLFTGAFTAAYAGSYASAYTGAFTGVYQSSFQGNFTSAYTSSWVGNFTGAYSGVYTGAFTGIYSGAYSQTFSGVYNGSFTRAFTGNFTGLTVQTSTTTTTYTLWVRTA